MPRHKPPRKPERQPERPPAPTPAESGPLSLGAKIGIILATLLVVLILGCLVGGAGCFMDNLWSGRRHGGESVGAIWFVLGVFAGMLQFFAAGEFCSPPSTRGWTNEEGSEATGSLVFWVSTAALFALSYLFYLLWWRPGVTSSDGYVPANMPLTLTFFITMIVSMFSSARLSRMAKS